jgi:hypothetical protein
MGLTDTPRALAASTALALSGVALSPATAHAMELVPASIDPTGRTDVTTQLQRFVASVPNGGTVAFRPRARYRIDGTLEWRDRTGITLDGRGATLVAGTHGGPTRAHIRLVDGAGWTVRNLIVRGANPDGGHFDPRYQWQHGVDLRGVDGATLVDVRVSGVFGDDVYVGLSTTSSRWSQDVTILRSTGTRSGRMAIAITAGRRVTVRGGAWSEPGLSTFDIEPNGRPGGADGILIEHTTIGAGARDCALSIAGSGPIANVTLRGNRLVGRPLKVRADQRNGRPRNIVVQDNVSVVPFAGPPPAAMLFRATDGVTVSGNVQVIRPGSSLAMVATQDSTRVDVAADQFPYREIGPGAPRVRYVVAALAAVLLLLLLGLRRRNA